MRILRIITLAAVLFFSGILLSKSAYAKTYKVSPKTAPCDSSRKYSNYDKNTKHYYMLKSYLNKIEKEKGGTLIIKKGTYKLPNTLYVASKTKIILKKGAVLKKTTKGGPVTDVSTTVFQFISQKNSEKTGVYGGHEGEHDIRLTGKGTIDLSYIKASKTSIAIIMGHNSNILVDGITFKNMGYSHFIEMDACKDVIVKNCTFTGFTPSGYYNKEAVNLDVPDPDRNGFNAQWSKKDKTPNEDITFDGCRFDKLETGVGTHRYTGDVYHMNVKITGCTFNECQTAIRIINYKNLSISENSFTDCTPNDRYPYAMFLAGVHSIIFSNNSFTNCGAADTTKALMQFWWLKGYSANQTRYAAVTSDLTEDEAALFMTNKAVNCGSILVRGPGESDVDFTRCCMRTG